MFPQTTGGSVPPKGSSLLV